MAEHILCIEDDKDIAQLLKYNLEKAGYTYSHRVTGEDAWPVLEQQKIDLIILDVMLPKKDGFEICRLIRQNKRWTHIPVIMLTAKGEEVDRIVGFELGADDYVVKPFSPRELLLRIKAIFKRGKVKAPEILNAGKICMDVAKHRVEVSGSEIDLSAMEFKLLAMLLRHKGHVLTRECLLKEVWGHSTEIYTRTIDTHIKLLRHKLHPYSDAIETVRGLGYRFNEHS